MNWRNIHYVSFLVFYYRLLKLLFHFKAMTMKKITKRTSKGPIAIMKVDTKGEFIVLENTCVKKVRN